MATNSFITLHKVFNNDSQRTLNYLAEYYSNRLSLIKDISSLFGNSFTQDSMKGKQVLLKPNWVNHDRYPNNPICLRTHNDFLLAALESVLQLNPAKVIIGDAPIQGCNWSKVCAPVLLNEIAALSQQYNVEVTIVDFRRVIYDSSNNQLLTNQNSISDYIIFDVGKKSYLEPICSNDKELFRVAQYDYKRLAKVHQKGIHKYCITKYLFESDIIISLPKIKTHQKTGITGALKNLVGLNGDKDYLPHHRIGGTKYGGDSYAGGNFFRQISEKVADASNKVIGKPLYKYLFKLALGIWKYSDPKNKHQWGAAWYGNDTSWRMVLDLNQLIIYGKSNGSLSNHPQRELYSLCDGIIAGQGNGPLFPEPLPLGFISFTNNSAINDYVFATLMKLNPDKIPLLKNAFSLYKNDLQNIKVNGENILFKDLDNYSIEAVLPPGWIDYLKNS